MCSISAGFTNETLRKLTSLNSKRGSINHSIAYIRFDGMVSSLKKESHPLEPEDINIPKGHFCLVHQQAPTTSIRSIEFIHPSVIIEDTDSYLWHNGILKEDTIKRLQIEQDSVCQWDTELLHRDILSNNTNLQKPLDGSFACVWLEGSHMNLFRNDLVSLYVSDDGISSTYFEGSSPLESNILWRLSIESSSFNYSKITKFNTTQNPYFFIDEV